MKKKITGIITGVVLFGVIAVTPISANDSLCDRYDTKPKDGYIGITEYISAVSNVTAWHSSLSWSEFFEVKDMYIKSVFNEKVCGEENE